MDQALLGPLLRRVEHWGRGSNRSSWSLPKGSGLSSLYGVRLRCVQGSGWRVSGSLPTPLGVLSAGGRRSALLLLLALQKWQFWQIRPEPKRL